MAGTLQLLTAVGWLAQGSRRKGEGRGFWGVLVLCREPGQGGLGDGPISEAIISCVRHAGVFWAPASSLPSYRFTPRGYVRVVSQGIGSARPPWGALPARLPTSPRGVGALVMLSGELGFARLMRPPCTHWCWGLSGLTAHTFWVLISPKNGRKRVSKVGEG